MVVTDEDEVLHLNRDAAEIGGVGVGSDGQGPLLLEAFRRRRGRLEHKVVVTVSEVVEGESLLEGYSDLA